MKIILLLAFVGVLALHALDVITETVMYTLLSAISGVGVYIVTKLEKVVVKKDKKITELDSRVEQLEKDKEHLIARVRKM